MRQVLEVTNDYIKTVDDNGVIRKIALASDAQFKYQNDLRIRLGKAPLKEKPAAYKAKKSIDFMLKQLEKKETKKSNEQQPLL